MTLRILLHMLYHSLHDFLLTLVEAVGTFFLIACLGLLMLRWIGLRSNTPYRRT